MRLHESVMLTSDSSKISETQDFGFLSYSIWFVCPWTLSQLFPRMTGTKETVMWTAQKYFITHFSVVPLGIRPKPRKTQRIRIKYSRGQKKAIRTEHLPLVHQDCCRLSGDIFRWRKSSECFRQNPQFLQLTLRCTLSPRTFSFHRSVAAPRLLNS